MFDEEALIVDMLEASSKSSLLKNARKEEIIAAEKSVQKINRIFAGIRHRSYQI